MNYYRLLLILLLNMATVSQILGNRPMRKQRFEREHGRALERPRRYRTTAIDEQYYGNYPEYCAPCQREKELLKDIADIVGDIKQLITIQQPQVQLVMPYFVPYYMPENYISNAIDKGSERAQVNTAGPVDKDLVNRFDTKDDEGTDLNEDPPAIIAQIIADEKAAAARNENKSEANDAKLNESMNCEAAVISCCTHLSTKLIKECFDKYNCNKYKCSNLIILEAANSLKNRINRMKQT